MQMCKFVVLLVAKRNFGGTGYGNRSVAELMTLGNNSVRPVLRGGRRSNPLFYLNFGKNVLPDTTIRWKKLYLYKKWLYEFSINK